VAKLDQAVAGRRSLFKSRPRYVTFVRPPTRRSRCFWGRIELDRGRDPEHALVFVVLDFDVEVFEKLGELGRLVVSERVAQVGDGGQRSLDRVGLEVARRPCLEARESCSARSRSAVSSTIRCLASATTGWVGSSCSSRRRACR
jgi:hypothetical protein